MPEISVSSGEFDQTIPKFFLKQMGRHVMIISSDVTLRYMLNFSMPMHIIMYKHRTEKPIKLCIVGSFFLTLIKPFQIPTDIFLGTDNQFR